MTHGAPDHRHSFDMQLLLGQLRKNRQAEHRALVALRIIQAAGTAVILWVVWIALGVI